MDMVKAYVVADTYREHELARAVLGLRRDECFRVGDWRDLQHVPLDAELLFYGPCLGRHAEVARDVGRGRGNALRRLDDEGCVWEDGKTFPVRCVKNPADGGYPVPPEFAEAITKAIVGDSILVGKAIEIGPLPTEGEGGTLLSSRGRGATEEDTMEMSEKAKAEVARVRSRARGLKILGCRLLEAGAGLGATVNALAPESEKLGEELVEEVAAKAQGLVNRAGELLAEADAEEARADHIESCRLCGTL